MKISRNSKSLLLIILPLALAGLFITASYIGRSNVKSGFLQTTSVVPPSQDTKTTSTITPSGSVCDCSFAISGPANVEFLVIDPMGRQTGYVKDNGSYVSDIPDASYGLQGGIGDDTSPEPPTSAIVYFGMNNPLGGIYELQVIGTGAGDYHIEIGFAWGPMDTKKIEFDGTLLAGGVDKYKISIPDGSVVKE